MFKFFENYKCGGRVWKFEFIMVFLRKFRNTMLNLHFTTHAPPAEFSKISKTDKSYTETCIYMFLINCEYFKKNWIYIYKYINIYTYIMSSTNFCSNRSAHFCFLFFCDHCFFSKPDIRMFFLLKWTPVSNYELLILYIYYLFTVLLHVLIHFWWLLIILKIFFQPIFF